MSTKETIKLAILTKSNKSRHDGGHGSCIAGVTSSGEWVRLVSDADGDSIPDIVAKQIPIRKVIEAEIEHVPLTYQVENAVLLDYSVTQDDEKHYIRNMKTIDESGIFGNASNRLTSSEMRHNQGTLRLINVEDLAIYRFENENCKVKFKYQGCIYDEIAMTDPNWYAKRGSERFVGNAYIVVSLPDNPPFLKFIAAIYPPRSH
jgi:hypothetical protein